MATPYTDANVFPNQIQLPDDGDPIDAASVNTGLEGLANRTRYLYILSGGVDIPDFYTHAALDVIRRPGGNDNNFGFNARITTNELVAASLLQVGTLTPVQRALPTSFIRTMDAPAQFDPLAWWSAAANEPTNPSLHYRQKYSPLGASSEVTRRLTFAMRLPASGTLSSIAVRVVPYSNPGITHTPFTFTRPSVAALVHNPQTGVNTPIGNVVDPSATVGVYETPHDVILTPTSTLFTGLQILIVSILGEFGSGAGTSSPTYATLGGVNIYPPRVTFTRQKIGED